jgi:hypothetical protein
VRGRVAVNFGKSNWRERRLSLAISLREPDAF